MYKPLSLVFTRSVENHIQQRLGINYTANLGGYIDYYESVRAHFIII